jgi:hypothetical protein
MKRTRTKRLRLVAQFGNSEPRVFDAFLCDSVEAVQEAITEGMKAFNQALQQSLEHSRRTQTSDATRAA